MRMPVGEPPFPDENEAGAASFFAELLLEGELAADFFADAAGAAGLSSSEPISASLPRRTGMPVCMAIMLAIARIDMPTGEITATPRRPSTRSGSGRP